MTALLRYQAALLLRSQRWLAPFLLYAAYVGVGVRPGEPLPGSLGYAATALVPVAAWAVRICLDQEPPAARTVVAAAAGPARAHLAAIVTATTAVLLVAWVTVLAVTAISNPHPGGAVAGLLAATACTLTGATVGALTTRPLVPSRGWSLSALLLGSLLALVTPGSPAKSALTTLFTASHATAPLSLPWPAVATALALMTAATAAACRLTARSG
ncbi:ABC transporter [Streptomyces sp. NPDC101160]|uniref:ABC transporter n=1 Tax=Streptomyces sp. NPDC101160 TaxID=3366118 RepID=UPI003804DEEE